VPTSCHLTRLPGRPALSPEIVRASLGRWEAWVSRVTPGAPTWARRRVEVEVEVRRVGQNRGGERRVGRALSNAARRHHIAAAAMRLLAGASTALVIGADCSAVASGSDDNCGSKKHRSEDAQHSGDLD
jgi:hypothetical protein